MKKLLKILFILLICVSFKTVYAENYKIKELIPYKTDTTIHTDNFSYKEIYFDKVGVHFNGIKNLTNEKLPISISIGLFNSKGKNIGTINYCNDSLSGKEEMNYIIKFEDKYLGKDVKISDIKYMSVLGDNITCKTKGSRDYIGQSVDKMGIRHKSLFEDTNTQLFLAVLTILGGAFIVLIIYKLIFTKSYKNIDGNLVRKSYDEINKELKEEREEELRNNPPVVEEKKPDKPVEILEQEENAKNEEKDSTDLHNMYK